MILLICGILKKKKTNKLVDTDTEQIGVARGRDEGRGNGWRGWKHRLPVIRQSSPGDIMYSKVTRDNNSIKRRLLFGRKIMTNLDSILKSRDITLPTKVRLVKAMVFFSGHVWMWELDYEEGWAPKNWCFWTVVLEKTLASPLDCKEIQPVYPKGDQPWVLFGRNDAKAETPVLWPPYAKSWLIGKDSDAGRDWGQEEKGTTEGEMTGWHHRLNAHEFE